MKNNKMIKYFGDGFWIKDGVETSFEEADIIVLPGGSDWNPALYGHEPIKATHWYDAVDQRQMAIINKAVEMGKSLFGICRGIQGLTIKAGGYLIQDASHPSEHTVTDFSGGKYSMNSCHHQICFPYSLSEEEYEVLSWTEQLSPRHIIEGEKQLEFPDVSLDENGVFKEPEVIWYPKINAIGTQGHP